MAEMTISINSALPNHVSAMAKKMVSRLAEDLAARVATLKQTAPKAGDSHLLVLAGLMLASDQRDLRRDVEAIRDDVSKAAGARGRSDGENGRYGRRRRRSTWCWRPKKWKRWSSPSTRRTNETAD